VYGAFERIVATLATAMAQNAWSTRHFTISVCSEGAQPRHLWRPVD